MTLPGTERETLIRVYEGTREPGRCKGCQAPIDWFVTVKNRKSMPVNRGAVPRKSEMDPETNTTVIFLSSADVHWATCSARDQFTRRR